MLRRHRSIAAVTVAVALSLVSISALSGCATEITGTATAGKIPSSSSASEDATEESSEESTEIPAEESSDESSVTEESTATDPPIPPVEPTSDGPGAPDDSGGSGGETATWFSTVCTGFDDLTSYSSPDVSGMNDEAALQTIVDAYTAMSQIAVNTADELTVMTPPAFPDSDTVATAITDWFYTVGDVYSAGATTIANGSFTDGDELADQIDQIEAGLDGVNQTLGSAMGLLDDDTKQLMAGLPECAALVGD